MNLTHHTTTSILSYTLWEQTTSSVKPDASLILRIKESRMPNVINVNNGKLRTKSFVGVAGWPDRQVQILPKLYRHDTDPEKEHTASRNLLHLLQLSGLLSSRLYTDTASLQLRKTNFFEVLIYLFASRLCGLLQQGMTRSYESVEDETPFLRGTWHLHHQLARKPYMAHSFHVCYDEFTENTALHRVLKYVTRLLAGMTDDNENRKLLADIIRSYANVDDCSTPDNDRHKIVFTRLNDSYQPIFTLAEMFLERLSVQLSHGGIRLWGLLFDMNKLFEKLVETLLHREHLLDGTQYNGCEINRENHATYLAYTRDRKPFLLLKPDIRITRGQATECIIDTKYKLPDLRLKKRGVKREKGIASEDMYQMAAYAHRFDCPRIILLYPAAPYFDRVSETTYYLADGKRIEIRAIDIRGDLHNTSDYNQLLDDLQRIIIGDPE